MKRSCDFAARRQDCHTSPPPGLCYFPCEALGKLSSPITRRTARQRSGCSRSISAATFEILPVPRLLCGKEAEGVRCSSLVSFRSLSLPVRAPSPLSPTATVAHSRFLFHGCSGSQKRSRMKNAYLAFRVEITVGGEQELRFKVQSDALQPCCSVLPPQIELISIDRTRGRGVGGGGVICLQGSTWKACLENFLSPQITSTISHLTFFQPCLFSGGDGLPCSIWSLLYSHTVWRWGGAEGLGWCDGVAIRSATFIRQSGSETQCAPDARSTRTLVTVWEDQMLGGTVEPPQIRLTSRGPGAARGFVYSWKVEGAAAAGGAAASVIL